MLNFTSCTSENSLIWQVPFSFSILILLTDNKWFDLDNWFDLDFVLKAFSEVDIHFVLFEFVVVLLWETMTFYWVIWGPHSGDPMGITLLKSCSCTLWHKWFERSPYFIFYLRCSKEYHANTKMKSLKIKL